jgi:fatty acid desaturase
MIAFVDETLRTESLREKTGNSKNTRNTAPKKMDRRDKMIVFNVLIIAIILVCESLVILYWELGRPIFLRLFWAHSNET